MVIICKFENKIIDVSVEEYINNKEKYKLLGRGYYIDLNSLIYLANDKRSVYCKELGIKPASFLINLSLIILSKFKFYKYEKYK